MNTQTVRRNLMGATGALGAAFTVSGILLVHPVLAVVGLLNLLTVSLWLYGQGLRDKRKR